MADMIKFYRGLASSLPATGDNGALYITTDEGAIYYGTGTGMKRLGDFIQVDNVAALPTKAHESCLYYCVAENILAKWNGTEWKQINKQPTAEELKTLLGLASLAYKSEVAESDLSAALAEKVNAASEGNHAHLNKDVLDGITADDITNWNDAVAKEHEHTFVESELNKIVAGDVEKWNNKVDAESGKSLIADTEITRLAGMSDGANKVEASATNGSIKIDGVETVVYTHPDKHAISDVDGLQDALDGKSDDGHKHVKADITDFDHAHVVADITDYATDVASKIEAYGYETVANVDDKDEQVLADAKAYVDEEDVFEIEMNTVNSLGGIGADQNLNGLTTHEILKKLLYPYVDASVGNATASPNGGTYEKGSTKTITQVSISITKKSEPITSVALYNGSTLIEEKTGDAVKNGGTITFTGLSVEVPTNGNQLTVKVTYPDADGNAKTVEKKTTALTFVYPYYMGSCAAGTAIDETLVESLTKKVESKGNKSNSFTVSDGHMVFAYPKAHGVLKSILDPNNFETIGNYTCNTVSVTGLDGTAQDYYVYVSGATTVSGFAVNFKY